MWCGVCNWFADNLQDLNWLLLSALLLALCYITDQKVSLTGQALFENAAMSCSSPRTPPPVPG